MNATHVFEMVSHHNNAEIVSLLDLYFLGNVEIPKILFDTDKTHVALYDEYYSFLNVVTIMVNTFEIDLDSSDVYKKMHLGHESIITGNVRFLSQRIQMHSRVILNLIPAIFGDKLRRLFAQTVACSLKRLSSGTSVPTPLSVHQIFSTDVSQSALCSLRLFRLFLTKEEVIPVVNLYV